MAPTRFFHHLLVVCYLSMTVARHETVHRHKRFDPAIEPTDSESKSLCPMLPITLDTNEDFAVKSRAANDVCPAVTDQLSLLKRDDDYSCSESKPCSNGACCSKKSGYCGYGPESCGTNGKSPNDVCWNNCDAHAECGRYAKEEGKTCPLNVCCS